MHHSDTSAQHVHLTHQAADIDKNLMDSVTVSAMKYEGISQFKEYG